MAATSILAGAVHTASDTPTAVRTPERPPANKKVKLSPSSDAPPQAPPEVVAGPSSNGAAHVHTGSKSTQTVSPGGKGKRRHGTKGPGGRGSPSAQDTPNLASIRQKISEQFDMEIVLKHRELRLIEQEIAKTQVCIEQLRRCSAIPFPSPEASLNPPPDLIPGFSPAQIGVIDGPYTRHYKTWLIPDETFDGSATNAGMSAAGVLPRSVVASDISSDQLLTVTGRPQRQSAMKVQARGTGETICVYRKRDGTVVKLVCGDCHRSNFNSAQGFINHCRIAHQTEYASHDAAAEACGHPIDPETTEQFIAPPIRGPVDGPARNTRGTQNAPAALSAVGSFLTPANVFRPAPPSSSSAPPPNTPAPASRKPGRRSGLTTTPASRTKGGNAKSKNKSSSSEKKNFATSNLSALLKEKNNKLDLNELVQETTGPRIDLSAVADGDAFDDLSGSEAGTATVSRKRRSESPPLYPGSTDGSEASDEMDLGGNESYRMPSSAPAFRVDGQGDVEMAMGDGYDASSSSDEGGYRSDGNASSSDDDDLYTADLPPAGQHANDLSMGTLFTTAAGDNALPLPGLNGLSMNPADASDSVGLGIGAFSPVSMHSPELQAHDHNLTYGQGAFEYGQSQESDNPKHVRFMFPSQTPN